MRKILKTGIKSKVVRVKKKKKTKKKSVLDEFFSTFTPTTLDYILLFINNNRNIKEK